MRSNFFSGFLKKITTKYDKRYFKIDLNESSFMYAKDQDSIDNPTFKVMLRDVISVTRNTVSMPIQAANGQITFQPRSIFDTTLDLDRGPNDDCQNVFEVKLSNRLFTLYTHDNNKMEQFVLYLSRIIELKQEIKKKQAIKDAEFAEQIKLHQMELRKSMGLSQVNVTNPVYKNSKMDSLSQNMMDNRLNLTQNISFVSNDQR